METWRHVSTIALLARVVSAGVEFRPGKGCGLRHEIKSVPDRKSIMTQCSLRTSLRYELPLMRPGGYFAVHCEIQFTHAASQDI